MTGCSGKFIHIVGRRNHGKTTLIQEMTRILLERGLRVGTIKHSAHQHELEAERKDSFKHRKAGAIPAGIIASNLMAIYIPRRESQDPYEKLQLLYDECDVVLVEGDVERMATKVEVFRMAMNTPSLVSERDDIKAVITDDPIQTEVPVWSRSDGQGLADKLLSLMGTV